MRVTLGRRVTGLLEPIDAMAYVSNGTLEGRPDLAHEPSDGALGLLYVEIRLPFGGDGAPIPRAFASRFEEGIVWITAEGKTGEEILDGCRAARRVQRTPIVVCDASVDGTRRFVYDACGYSTTQRINPLWWTIAQARAYGFGGIP